MLLESLSHLAAGDIGWLFSVAIENLAIAFMLLSVFFVFLEGKNFLKGSIVIFITLFAFMDFGKVLGVTFFSTNFMLLYYISKIAVLSIAEGVPFMKKNLIFINELQFYGALAVSLLFTG
ncbi:MAG: hypothetical protein HY544_02415 [Candidatus Diapherotrites archaeon]|uniref:Uncharacterized protein n=1 Tax=Candidatus Iainarchaeum sp. TaxID=3101447 RepID=A0A8T3YL27_9ARCH|nr:hypothetical protein [Candidatus Diapherotrites archaeon]